MPSPTVVVKKVGKDIPTMQWFAQSSLWNANAFHILPNWFDYLNNNLLIAYYCGFDIVKKLPGYHAFERFIKNFDNTLLKKLMASQVKKLYDMGIVDASFIAIDSTPIAANTTQNNPKSFSKNKFDPQNHPKYVGVFFQCCSKPFIHCLYCLARHCSLCRYHSKT